MCWKLRNSILWLLLLVGCTTTSPPVTSTPTTFECARFAVACIPYENGLLLQTNTQTTITVEAVSITFDSTIYITQQPIVITTLEGLNVVSAGGNTRIIQAGAQVSININGQPAEPLPYDVRMLQNAPLNDLPRLISLPIPIAGRQQSSDQPQNDPGCSRPEDWTGIYTVQRGDTLTRIANANAITLQDLQTYNCITDPNRLTPGDILFVPGVNAENTFIAERDTLTAGECTTLQWQMESARLVYFQGEAVPRTDSQNVCPQSTTTYTLLVVFENGEQIGYTVTVTVQ